MLSGKKDLRQIMRRREKKMKKGNLKKLLAVMMSAAMVASMAGCGSSAATSGNSFKSGVNRDSGSGNRGYFRTGG